MIGSAKDIFGQIDALLERRGSEVLSEKSVSTDDFPTLTDVIEQEMIGGRSDVNTVMPKSEPDRRQTTERRLLQRRLPCDVTVEVSSTGLSDPEVKDSLTQELLGVFKWQQMRIEEIVRRVVQEELAAMRRDKP